VSTIAQANDPVDRPEFRPPSLPSPPEGRRVILESGTSVPSDSKDGVTPEGTEYRCFDVVGMQRWAHIVVDLNWFWKNSFALETILLESREIIKAKDLQIDLLKKNAERFDLLADESASARRRNLWINIGLSVALALETTVGIIQEVRR
jgi:hypothetical protein